jgi:transcriptional regulator with XRE-family HTH domain
MKTSEYLDLAQKKLEVKNDNQLVDKMGWAKSQVNNYRHNRQQMDNEAARKIAELLEIPVWKVIADMETLRAKDEPTRKAWKMLAKLSNQKGVALPSALILNVFIFCGATLCILCKIALQAKRLSTDVSPNYLELA